MAEKDEARTDADKLDKIIGHLDGFGKRMDAMETMIGDSMKRADAANARCDAWEEAAKDKARKDAEEKEEAVKKDKARKDAEEETKMKADKARKDAEEEEEAKKDKARKDAQTGPTNADLAAQIAALNQQLRATDLPESDRQIMTAVQARFEPLAQAFGDSAGAPRWVRGETARQYETRLASKYKEHSKKFKDTDLSTIGDNAAYEHVVQTIYNDAMAAAANPVNLAPDTLIPREFKDATGRVITKFIGSAGACWNRFKSPYRYVKRWGDAEKGQTVF